jgi:hypothetical protein
MALAGISRRAAFGQYRPSHGGAVARSWSGEQLHAMFTERVDLIRNKQIEAGGWEVKFR